MILVSADALGLVGLSWEVTAGVGLDWDNIATPNMLDCCRDGKHWQKW